MHHFLFCNFTGSVLLSLILATPPIFGWGRYEFIAQQHFCFAAWKDSQSFTIFMIVTCFVCPLACMSFCYLKIITGVRTSQNRVNSNVRVDTSDVSVISKHSEINIEETDISCQGDPVASKLNNELGPSNNPQLHEVGCPKVSAEVSRRQYLLNDDKKVKKKRMKDLQLSLTLFIVVVVFVLCWLPYCIVMLITTFSNYSVSSPVWTSVLFGGFLNSGCNPITYGVINREIRNNYKKLLAKIKKAIVCS